jgi:lipoprotein-anchoring transpeptidase ErfK/SrfK
VAEAERLLSSFFDVRLYDPKTGDSVYWSLPPQQWAAWLSATPDPTSASGLSLSVTAGAVRDFLSAQADSMLDSSRYIQVDEGVTSVQQAVAAGRTNAYLRVYHHDLQHVVQAGDTIVSLAWDYGVPYPWIQDANPGVDSLTVGQTITIPSVDNFLPYPPNPDKRIVISISQQRAWIYENGELKWEWTISTGIQSSPTWPGIYQILSHEVNAYAANWNLWMPHFMGVYNPIPHSDFTNGLHGFPTRGGGQLLWENNLGTRVTYGCILLSNTNAETLYNWAEEGVIVEIQA